MSDDTLQPGTLVAGRLRVVRTLGTGGMGAVYEVEHEVTKHRRALKLLHAGFASTPAIVKRFLNEASAAGRIGSEHIIETFDAGQLDAGEPYLVMELLDGEPLADKLERGGPLKPQPAVELMLQACAGVGAAHQAGIIHRDLKPDNLFVVNGEPPLLKLFDFGVSKFDPELTGEQSTTRVGGLMGTPHYMPPEQMRGVPVGPPADIYALGVILYECVSGKLPYQAESLAELAVAVEQGEYASLASLGVPRANELDPIVHRALQRQPGDRYQSAEEFASALGSLQNERETSTGTVLLGDEAAPAVTSSGKDAQPAAPEPGKQTSLPASYKAWSLVALLGVVGIGIGIAALKAPSDTSATAEPNAGDSESGPVVAPVASAPAVSASATLGKSTPPIAASSSATAAKTASASPPTKRPVVATPPPKSTGTGGRAKEHGLATELP